jgi:TRAP-type C4-dicarboxylate transport system permease small subunit
MLATVLAKVSRVLLGLERASMAVAGVCFVAIVLITATDVAMRYALNAPLIWAYTLISDYLMVAIFFLAIAATQRQGQNIGVDMVVRRLPERLRAGLALLCLVLMALFMALMGSAGWDVFMDAWRNGDELAGTIPWPRWPALLLVPVGAVLLLLRILVDLVANLIAVLTGDMSLAPHRRPRVHTGFSHEE